MNRTVTFLVTLVAVLIAGQSASAQEYDVSFKSANGSFVVAENGGGGVVNANREEIGAWERFTLIDLNGGRLRSGDPVNIRAANGMYMVAENGGGSVVNANRRAAALWEKFAIIKVARGDVSGNVIRTGDTIVLQASNNQYVVAENGGGGVVNANRNAIAAWEKFTIIVHSR